MKINIKNDRREIIERARDPEEEYDGDDTFTNHEITGVEEVQGKGYYELQTDFDLKRNKDYYLICAFYDTGDSFSRQENRVSYLDVFSDPEKAKALVAKIKKDYEQYLKHKNTDREKQKGLKYTTQGGNEVTLYTGTWKGYFEDLRNVEVITVKLE